MTSLQNSTSRSVTTCTLAELPPSTEAVIVGFSCDDITTRRLRDIGFLPGTPTVLMRKAPLRDPLMFDVGGCEIVLRRRDAQHILVTT